MELVSGCDDLLGYVYSGRIERMEMVGGCDGLMRCLSSGLLQS